MRAAESVTEVSLFASLMHDASTNQIDRSDTEYRYVLQVVECKACLCVRQQTTIRLCSHACITCIVTKASPQCYCESRGWSISTVHPSKQKHATDGAAHTRTALYAVPYNLHGKMRHSSKPRITTRSGRLTLTALTV